MRVFVTGTDTDVGKTIASAWLMLHLDADYWKPVQSGLDDESDAAAVQRLTGADDDRFHPNAYALPEPLSPHESARRAGVEIEMTRFRLPETDRPLIVEGAGGLMVPLNDSAFVIDLIAELALPAILVCRSTLGTINHSLLSIEAMRRRGLPLAGVVLNGPPTPHNRAAIESYGKARVIAEIPPLAPLTTEALRRIAPECDLNQL